MKLTIKSILVGALLSSSVSVLANHPDSVYVKAYNPSPGDGLRVSYSADQKTWIPIGDNLNLFKSDYGPWGSEKKMYNPVLRYDGKKFYAEFIPNPKHAEIATTESSDLYLWKPQDYLKLSEPEFEATKAELEKGSKNNIIKVPYSIVENLIAKAALAQINGQHDRENMGIRLDEKASVFSRLNINLNDKKPISPELFGIFFEDINYAADGGIYAELIQNRDFEFTEDDGRGRNAKYAWATEGDGITWNISTVKPLHANNPHFSVININVVGSKLVNEGWDGIPLKKGTKYDYSMFLVGNGKVKVSLEENGKTLASTILSATADWKQLKSVLVPNADATKAKLCIEPLQAGTLSIDFVSLFPQDTFKGRKNGLRKDLAQLLADMKPQFIRFPGGCASHGQGMDNIYHWQATVGELWERIPDFNIWGYHQSRGLGFYEYFQFCEDIGATPLPVLAAGVPCQNSWKGGNGQNGGIPFAKDLNGKPSPYKYMGKDLTMESYLQELLDLIEWANGDARTSKLAQMRAKAGHPKPFNMKYLGIGNEDLLGDVFNERFTFLYEGVKKAHPEITIVGTVGPFWEGSDYEYGWKEAKRQQIPIVDEHYYNPVGWYLNHQDYYDKYDRNGTKVYLGEWASKGNNLDNALAEAIHITNVERNADVVTMSSYAPLLAKEGHTQWNPDLIYFNNTEVKPTTNYWVQALSGQNAGDEYVYSDLELTVDNVNRADIQKRVASSVVIDKETGDIIIKLVNALPISNNLTLNLGSDITFGMKNADYSGKAEVTFISNKDLRSKNLTPESKTINVGNKFNFTLPVNSFSIIRIKKN